MINTNPHDIARGARLDLPELGGLFPYFWYHDDLEWNHGTHAYSCVIRVRSSNKLAIPLVLDVNIMVFISLLQLSY